MRKPTSYDYDNFEELVRKDGNGSILSLFNKGCPLFLERYNVIYKAVMDVTSARGYVLEFVCHLYDRYDEKNRVWYRPEVKDKKVKRKRR